MKDFYFDFTSTCSIKAKTQDEAIKMINSFNVIGLDMITSVRNGEFKTIAVKLHDVEIEHEPAV